MNATMTTTTIDDLIAKYERIRRAAIETSAKATAAYKFSGFGMAARAEEEICEMVLADLRSLKRLER
jgi:hypothetical protein